MEMSVVICFCSLQCLDGGLEMTTEELSVWGLKDGKQYPCIMKGKNKTHTGANYFICQIQNTTHVKFSQLTVILLIRNVQSEHLRGDTSNSPSVQQCCL